uniref:PP4R3 domain-containing protein n=1 Tax=Panagrellus redivivus TaxID=6233 RepID=A0A7E4UTK5_PANRE
MAQLPDNFDVNPEPQQQPPTTEEAPAASDPTPAPSAPVLASPLVDEERNSLNLANEEAVDKATSESPTELTFATVADVESVLGPPEADNKENSKDRPSTSEEEEDGPTLSNIAIDKAAANRVKLYVLCEQKAWDDKGTGHVACVRVPKNPIEWSLIVRLEQEDRNILESKISETTIYQRQQGTLIVWTENENCDLALSFQEKQGCEDVWYQLRRIQRREVSPMEDDVESDSSESQVSSWPSSLSLPPVEMGRITELENMLNSSLSSNSNRELMAHSLLRSNYLTSLCDLFETAESMGETIVLSSLASIAKDMFLLNNENLLSEMISERHFRPIVGMLEYDTTMKGENKKHREFLFDRSHFREVLPITNHELRAKITETFRLQYVLDVCLPAPSLFEENLMTTISSTIFFHRVKIVSALMSDKELLRQLFAELKQKDLNVARQKDLTNFLKEFVVFAQALQPNSPQGREQFFKMLLTYDVFQILDPCLSSPLHATQIMIVDLLIQIVDFTLNNFREFLRTQDVAESENLLIVKMINYMVNDKDPEFTNSHNMAEVLRVLLDSETGVRSECEPFLKFFYARGFIYLVKPILDLTAGGQLARDDYYTCRQVCTILSTLIFCVKNHELFARRFIIERDVLTNIAVLLKSKHHMISLKAVRLFRRIVDLRDEDYYKYIIGKEIMTPIVEAFLANGPRYNLLNSCFLDFFEFVIHEDIAPLVDYLSTHHLADLESITYVKTFSTIKLRYQGRHQKEMSVTSSASEQSSAPSTPVKALPETLAAQFEKERRHEEDDAFFSEDNEDKSEADAEGASADGKKPMRKSGFEPMFPSLPKRKTNEEEGVASIFGGNAATPNLIPSNGNNKIKMTFNIAGAKSLPVAEKPKNTSVQPIPLNPRYRRHSLVSYDDSDSDSDEENSVVTHSAPPSVCMSPVKADVDPQPTTSTANTENCDTNMEFAVSESRSDTSLSPSINGESRKRRRPSDEGEDENGSRTDDIERRSEKRQRSDSPKRHDFRHLNGHSNSNLPSLDESPISPIPVKSPQSCGIEAANDSRSASNQRIYESPTEETPSTNGEISHNSTPSSPATTV